MEPEDRARDPEQLDRRRAAARKSMRALRRRRKEADAVFSVAVAQAPTGLRSIADCLNALTVEYQRVTTSRRLTVAQRVRLTVALVEASERLISDHELQEKLDELEAFMKTMRARGAA